MGLRLREALSLTASDIDSQRMCLNVRNAKGNRDRFVVMTTGYVTDAPSLPLRPSQRLQSEEARLQPRTK